MYDQADLEPAWSYTGMQYPAPIVCLDFFFFLELGLKVGMFYIVILILMTSMGEIRKEVSS